MPLPARFTKFTDTDSGWRNWVILTSVLLLAYFLSHTGFMLARDYEDGILRIM